MVKVILKIVASRIRTRIKKKGVGITGGSFSQLDQGMVFMSPIGPLNLPGPRINVSTGLMEILRTETQMGGQKQTIYRTFSKRLDSFATNINVNSPCLAPVMSDPRLPEI